MVVHAHIAEVLGKEETAADYFTHALKSDIQDTQGGTTQEGIHVGVMGGTINVFLCSYAGLSVSEECICFNPRLPKKWKRVKFHIRHRNVWFTVEIKGKNMSIMAEPLHDLPSHPSADVPVVVQGKKVSA